MKKRNLAAVILLTIFTLGIYSIFWAYLTAKEMRTKGANIPHFILYFIPFANYYWLYRYSMGVETVSKGKMSGILVFLLWILTGIGGMIVAQIGLNDAIDAESASPTMQQPAVAPATPAIPAEAPQATTPSPIVEVSPEPTAETPTPIEGPKPPVV